MKINTSLEIIKSLADSSRLRIINSLEEKPLCVEELAERLNLAASTTSFHLKKLEKANLVTKVKDQYYIVYTLNKDFFDLPLWNLVNFDDGDRFVQDERMEKYKQKVLKAFMKNNKIIKLPVQKKKQMIIINEIKKLFSNDTNYSETQVNEKILSMYDDYCTVRRIMIEEGLMNRKNGIYSLIKENNNGK